MVILPSHGLNGALFRGEITKMKRLSIDSQIKSARIGYKDQAIIIMIIPSSALHIALI